MALIWRTRFETDGEVGRRDAEQLFGAWVARKLRMPRFEMPGVGDDPIERDGASVTVSGGETADAAVWRASFYEGLPTARPGEQIKTTFTVFRSQDRHWIWIDVENWKREPFARSWVPYAPRLARDAIARFGAWRGGERLVSDPVTLLGQDGAGLAEQVTRPGREIPVVVVTPTRTELHERDDSTATRRASALLDRLRGIAQVCVLSTGAVTEFSRALTERHGPGWDVHSGAIRTYLPFREEFRTVRHNLLRPERVAGREEDSIVRLVAPPLLRAACAQMPPPRWRATGQPLAENAATDVPAASVSEAAADLADAQETNDRLTLRVEDLEIRYEALGEELVEALKTVDRLQRRNGFLEREARERGTSISVAYDETPRKEPEDCSEVLAFAEQQFDHISICDAAMDGADALDAHNNATWVRKAWSDLQALNAYAEAKASGDSRSLWSYMEAGEGHVIPMSRIAMKESESTDTNSKYRQLRTFEVSERVGAKSPVYMPAHVKLEKGGTVAPRIHFLDDTGGPSGKVHIGWFGPHLENDSKN